MTNPTRLLLLIAGVLLLSVPSATAQETLRNFDPNAEPVTWVVDDVAPQDSGFVFGTNWFEDIAKATFLQAPESMPNAVVTTVRIWWAYKNAGITNETYSIDIYDGDVDTGPQNLLASEEFALADILADDDLENDLDGPMEITLSQPVPVGAAFKTDSQAGGAFFVSINFGTYGDAGFARAGIAATGFLGQGRIPEEWEQWSDNSWVNMSDAWFDPSAPDGWHMFVEADVEENVASATESDSEIPTALLLEQNYPNPFNPSTQIQYALPQSGHVVLTVHDVLGQEVDRLVDREMASGTYQVPFNAVDLPSGSYFYTIRFGDQVITRTMFLTK